MTEAGFEQLVAKWLEDLRAKQATLENVYGLGRFDRYDRDGDEGVIRFSNANEDKVLVARATDIGSFSCKTRTWMWAWANESVSEEGRAKSARIKTLADLTGFDLFREPQLDADEYLAWELAAIAVHHLGAIGCYRAPSDQLWIFLTIDDLQAERRAT
jgi:hypothetical protein